MEGAPAEVDAIQELMARIGNFVAEHPAAAQANNISVAAPVDSVQPGASPITSVSNHSANVATARDHAARLATSMGIGQPRRTLYLGNRNAQGPPKKKAKVDTQTSKGYKTLSGGIWFYGVTSKPKQGYGTNGVTAIIKDDGVDFTVSRVNGSERAMYKKCIEKFKFHETATLQTSMRQVVKLVMPQISASDTERLDLVASGMMIFVHPVGAPQSKQVRMQMLARRALSPEDVEDKGDDWIGSFMGLYRRTRTGQNLVHMVLDPAFVYNHWDRIPGEVRVGVLGKEQYKSMHSFQGGLDAGGIDTFLPSPLCGGPPAVANDSAVANDTESGICAVLSGAYAS